MEYGLLGLLVLIADVYAIYKVLTSGASALAKIVWSALILVLPVLGFIIWLVAGLRGNAATGQDNQYTLLRPFRREVSEFRSPSQRSM